jgi:hypothetical protein
MGYSDCKQPSQWHLSKDHAGEVLTKNNVTLREARSFT